jgi:two-component system, NtrC family, response regulator PilR
VNSEKRNDPRGETMADQGQISILLMARTKAQNKQFAGWLEPRGFVVSAAATAEEALALADSRYFDLVLMAERLGAKDTGPFGERLVELFPETLVTVLAAEPEVARAVTALRRGAFNYLPVPDSSEELLALVEDALVFRQQRREKVRHLRQASRKYDVENIVGQSQPMQGVFRLIHKVAPTDSTVLILGESGTGKELVARAIHHQSSRGDFPLVTVNCGAIPGELLESELFGHEKGAFTGAVRTRVGRFEMAQGGTVFLDEIGDMPTMLQVKILRVLQEHQFERVGGTRTIDVDIRVLAATNQDLASLVAQGAFREDLYYRLNVVPIQVPPLRERRSDIPLLCEHFLERFAQQKGLERKSLSPAVAEALARYDWPGNVRELENLLERMVVLAEDEVIGSDSLPPKFMDPAAGEPTNGGLDDLPEVELPPQGLNLKAAVDQMERKLILQALQRTGGVKTQAAALLGLNRTTLVEKMKKMGLASGRG